MAGGPVLTLCDTGLARGGTWSKKDVLVWGGFGTGTFRVPAAGGRATVVTAPGKASAGDHRFPWFLPDGRHFLYMDTTSNREESGIYVADLESQDRKRVLAADSNAVYSPPGYLLFVREGALMAQPFDTDKLQVTGDAVPVADQVDSQATRAQNQFSISQNGVLAYTSGRGGGGSAPYLVRSVRQGDWHARRSERVKLGRHFSGWQDRGGATHRPGPQGHLAARSGSWRRFPIHLRSGEQQLSGMVSRTAAMSRFLLSVTASTRPYRRATSGTGQDEVLSQPLGEPPSPTVVEDWSRDGRYARPESGEPENAV